MGPSISLISSISSSSSSAFAPELRRKPSIFSSRRSVIAVRAMVLHSRYQSQSFSSALARRASSSSVSGGASPFSMVPSSSIRPRAWAIHLGRQPALLEQGPGIRALGIGLAGIVLVQVGQPVDEGPHRDHYLGAIGLVEVEEEPIVHGRKTEL